VNTGGLGSADFNKFLAQLALPHNWKTSVDLLDDVGAHLVSFDPGHGGGRDVVVTDAGVQVNRDGRILSLPVADPYKELLVGQNANYIDRQLQVRAGVDVPALGITVWTHVFTGPVVSAPRSGDVVNFTAHGKERFAKHGIRVPYTVKKGVKITDAIKRILAQLCGEQAKHMGNIPDLAPVLTDDLVIPVMQRPWQVCLDLADQLGRYFLYDGAGDVQMPRQDATNPVYTFTGALNQPGVIGSDVEVSTDWTLVKNAVRRNGTPPKSGGPPPVPGLAIADPANPFSPERLGRNGVSIYYWDTATLPNVHTHDDLQGLAEQALARDLTANRQVKFETLPMPCFDYGDLVGIETIGLATTFFLNAFSIPLLLEQTPLMSIGTNQRVSSNAFAKRAG
jgi:hypothetical protein